MFEAVMNDLSVMVNCTEVICCGIRKEGAGVITKDLLWGGKLQILVVE